MIVEVDGREIGLTKPIFITAEIGKNHNGRIESAKSMIDMAKECGVDAVKFQTHIVEDELLREQPMLPYFKKPRYEWIKLNSLPKEWYEEIFEYGRKKGMISYSTPMSVEAARMLDEIGISLFKIGSGDLTDIPMLEYVAGLGKPIMLSTGMSTLEEIRDAIDVILPHNKAIILMHCTSLYPCPPEYANLTVIKTLQNRFQLPVGFSDHTFSIYTAMASVPMGIVAIEKHFTLDKGLDGPDHGFSINPIELKALVHGIREVEKGLGDGEKRLAPDEQVLRSIFRKCIVSKRAISKGDLIEREALTTKRPLRGLPPSEMSNVVGKRARVHIDSDTSISYDMVE